ncbi:MAG: phosphoribosylanthranilate isomerase [Pseudomonadota bacterium]
MRGYVKICGLTSADMVLAAIEGGANAIGFVFADSPRNVGIEQAVLLAGLARGHAHIIAVMQHPTVAQAHEIQARVQPDYLQTDAEDFAQLTLLSGITALPVFRDVVPVTAEAWSRILFEGAVSGAGSQADWQVAAQAAQRHQLLLAGGLNVANVGDAIRAVRPFGVDVSSGVESSRGTKDAAMITTFIQNARAAFNEEPQT